ncbi:MAG TPA: AAA family ATPase [Anaerolineales bacterium]|nr:AAA family ATPase [Anaerolineales bacterium]
MAQLKISLLGSIQVTLDGQPVTGFKSNKVRALLAYLAVESDKPHRRETLAGLFWPEWPEREALGNLRYTLSDLRGAIGDRSAKPPFLIISRESIQFNVSSDYQLDVTDLSKSLADKNVSIEERENILDLYKGRFLEGFSVEDSPAFEEWALLTREKLARQTSTVIHSLADFHEEQGDYKRTQSVAWRQLELEPWDETAHQQLMRTMALSGQRSAALAQYESCQKILNEELNVEPSDETKELYNQIRDGKLKTSNPSTIARLDHSPQPPPFFEMESPKVETSLVVARESELERLNGFLDQALMGQGCVVFVTGEAGSGKTSVIQEFTRRAQEGNQDLVVASGNCNAYSGIGDPYLPFREILELLTGDVESRWAAGTITKDHAFRLWNKLPVSVQALIDTGSDLIDTFIHRTTLLERVKISASGEPDCLAGLERLLKRKPTTALSAAALHQVDLFEQYTRVLQTLEHKSPLLLVIDDLQWADAGSINQLFHLGRRLGGCRILIIGAYRSEEITLGRGGERHPLEPVINEFRREFGDILINVDQIEGRKFIEALLDSESHRLGPSFREMLYHQTQGHPMFTIELLRGLQDRRDIIRDADGYWIEGQSLDWVTLPVRVEAAVQERIGRLPEPLQKILTVASVEGEYFTAELVAQVRECDKNEILEYLSGELDRKHRLIQAQSIQRVNGKSLSRYRFRHILFQKYLYSRLDEVERVHLHERIGITLEELYGDQIDVLANPVQLALHFEKAQITEKAIHYLHNAGKRAIQLSAYQEGIANLTKGLNLLEYLKDSSEHDHQKLNLLLALGIAWQGTQGAQPDEVKNAYIEALELCKRVGNTTQMVQVLGGLVVLYYVRGEHHRALEFAREGLALSEKADEPLLMLLCRWYLGFINFCFGNFVSAHEHLKHVIDFYDHDQHHRSLVYLRGSDAGLGAMAYEACCLWCLGYPEQALKLSKKTLSLARELGHPFTLADVFCFAGCLFHEMRRDGNSLESIADDLMRISQERNLAGWFATGARYRGAAFVLQGKKQEGVKHTREGIDAMKSENIWIYSSGTLAAMAELYAKTGDLEEALNILDEAFAFVEKTDERYWESELHRLKGEILLRQGEINYAETSFAKAVEISRGQSAKLLELWAVMSLCQLWGKQGKKTEAHHLLTEIYNWFTEGFDTPDLVKAKKMIQELS